MQLCTVVCGPASRKTYVKGRSLNTHIDEGRISHVVNHVRLRFCTREAEGGGEEERDGEDEDEEK